MTDRQSERGAKSRVFTTQFRQEAVQPVLRDGKSQAQAAGELQIFDESSANWVSQARRGQLGAVDSCRVTPVSDSQAEISRLKRELAQAREERDILEKAAAYFASVSP
jgi:transposase